MKKKTLRKLIASVSLLAIYSVIFYGCRKTDHVSREKSQETVLLESRFFTVSTLIDPKIKGIVDRLKRANSQQPFVQRIVKEAGFPVWEKAIVGSLFEYISETEPLTAGSNDPIDTNFVYIPIVVNGTTEVNAVFVCKLFDDSVQVKYFNEKDYVRAGFNHTSDFNANRLVGLIMQIQNRVYGTTSFVINDGRLFSNSQDSTTKRIVRLTKDSQNNGSTTDDDIVGLQVAPISDWCISVFSPDCGNMGACTYHTCYSWYTGLWSGGPSGSGSMPSGPGEVQQPGLDPGGGSNGGGNYNYGSVSTQTLLQQILLLNGLEVDFLNNYSQLSEEIYHYLNNNDGQFTAEERKLMANSHIDYLMESTTYLNHCLQANTLFFTLNGFTVPWFHQGAIGAENAELYSNIQQLKLDAKQAYYLLSAPALNFEVNKFLQRYSYSIDVKNEILQKLFPDHNSGKAFENITAPSVAQDDPIIDNGITVDDIPQTPPQQPGRRIGKTANRNNTEDMQYGTNGDVSGILTAEVSKDNNALFSNMSNLFYWCTIRDNALAIVGTEMIERFRTNTAPSTLYENTVLNQKVEYSAAFVNFLKLFGNTLRDRLIEKQGNISEVNEIDMGNARPIFNGFFNKTNGLQILINDTEYTEIELDEFHVDINGKWTADVTVTIYDHFGLDKLDALVYQNKHSGFADWWLLQHTRGFIPYTTKVTVRKRISGQL